MQQERLERLQVSLFSQLSATGDAWGSGLLPPPLVVAVAWAGRLGALVGMNSDPAALRRRDDLQRVDHAGGPVQALVGLVTAVATALSGVYMATRSVTVTALVAGLIAVLAACVLLRPHCRRQGNSSSVALHIGGSSPHYLCDRAREQRTKGGVVVSERLP